MLVSQFSIAVKKILKKTNLKGRRIIFTRGFMGFTWLYFFWFWKKVGLEKSCPYHGGERKDREGERETEKESMRKRSGTK
jgi:hypothetical protein